MNRIDVGAGALFLLSVIYFFGGITSLFALLIAVAVHEFGHIAAIRLFGGRIQMLKIGISGLCIRYYGALGTVNSVICLCAGPAMGLALAYAASYLGNQSQNLLLIKTAGFSLVLSVYNSLPALPLDGGRALQCLAERVFGVSFAQTLLELSGMLTGAALLFAGAFFIRQGFGAALLIAGVWVLTAQTGIVKT